MGVVAQVDTATGKVLDQKSTDQAAHTYDQSLSLTHSILNADGTLKSTLSDILPVYYRNIQASADYTGVLAAEVTEVDLTLASHSGKTVAATALVVSCSGGSNFRGVLVVIGLSNTSEAALAMTTAAAPNSANVAHHKSVFFCPPGVTLIPYNDTIDLVHMLADDTDGSEANTVQVSPL